MLQRQIMFKQFQEMQRRQQLQDTGEGRKPNYVNQLGSLKQASGTQFPQPNNGATINDMFMFGNNMDMVQHSGSANFQGFGNGLSMSQPQNVSACALGFSQPQFGVPLYSHLQGPSNDSSNLLAYGNSVMGQRSNFSSDQISFPEGSLLPNQVFEEKNLFGQSLVQGFNDGNLQPRNTSNLESKVSVCTSLDPLEQKILFNTDDNGDTGGLTSTLDLTSYMDELPSLQSGSWSALMQSAVAETSKPEPLYQNFGFPGFQQSVDQYGKQRDESHSESSHSSIQQSPRNTNKWSSDCSPQHKQIVEGSQSLPGFWPGQRPENLKNDTDQSSFLSYSNMNRPFGGLSGHESRGKLHGSTPQFTTGGSQNSFEQVQQPYNQRYSIESAKLTPGNSFVPTSSLFGSLSHPHIQHGPAQTSESMLDLLNKDDMSIENASGNFNPNESTQNEVPLTETPATFGKSYNTSSVTQGFGLRLGPADQQTLQPLSFFQTFSGNSSEASPSSNLASKFPVYNSSTARDNGPLKQNAHLFNQELPILGSVPVAQPSMTSGLSQHVGPSNVWPDLFRSSDLALSNLQQSQKHENTIQEYGNYSGKSDGKDGSHQYGSTGVGPSIPQSRPTHEQESTEKQISNVAQQRGNQTPYNGLHQNIPFNLPVQTSLQPNGTEKNDPFSSVNDKKISAFGQNGTQSPSIGTNQGSNVTYQSQISLQMAPSWFKHYGTLKNEQIRAPLLDANADINPAHQISGRTSLPAMQVNLGGQGSATWQIKQLPPANMSPSDVAYQNLAASRPKKRKFVAFELTPWHKEVTQNSGRLQNISTAELEWAQATNKIFEEVKMEAIVLEDMNPVVRAKRRLVFTTQLMQQVFRPPPTAILSADARSNYDFMVYFAARLTLGDACSLAGNPQIPSGDSSDKSSEKPETSKRMGAYDFSKIAEGFTSQTKMLKDNMLRLEKSLSIMDVKAEAQELEKFSTINRMAKFHGRAHQGAVDGASSSNSTMLTQKLIQRYVIAVPMPRIIPDGANCLSL